MMIYVYPNIFQIYPWSNLGRCSTSHFRSPRLFLKILNKNRLWHILYMLVISSVFLTPIVILSVFPWTFTSMKVLINNFCIFEMIFIHTSIKSLIIFHPARHYYLEHQSILLSWFSYTCIAELCYFGLAQVVRLS